MSFGNFHLHRPEPSQGYTSGRTRPLGRDSESGRRLQPVRESSTAVRAESRTNLTVITAEGDRVTISLAAQAKFTAASQTGPNGNPQTVATSSSSQLKVDVKGDLSDTELKDLGALINALGKATSQSASTGVPDASAITTSFAGLESLAAFAYSYNQTVAGGTFLNSKG
jgi:hypothetical protein